jgi:enamine deaminase RidA (YjgF/YER057c/UK114 family)
MRERIERERVKPPDASSLHLKLGVGSLADVQFAVELSLMRFGGRHPEVRTRRTLDAIERLAEVRLIEDSVALALGEAFVFLSVKDAPVDRRVHRVDRRRPRSSSRSPAGWVTRSIRGRRSSRTTGGSRGAPVGRWSGSSTRRDEMGRRLVSSGSPYEPVIGFSRAVADGHHVAVAGTAPVMPADAYPPPDAYGQAKRVLEIVLAALAEAGASAEHVVRTRTFLTSAEDWEEVGRAHGEVFGHVRPASTMVVVSGFLDPRWVVEMEADALLPSRRDERPDGCDRRVERVRP